MAGRPFYRRVHELPVFETAYGVETCGYGCFFLHDGTDGERAGFS
jgi:hypothetical protein